MYYVIDRIESVDVQVDKLVGFAPRWQCSFEIFVSNVRRCGIVNAELVVESMDFISHALKGGKGIECLLRELIQVAEL